MATAAVLFIGGGILAATNNYWLPQVMRQFAHVPEEPVVIVKRELQTGQIAVPQTPVAPPPMPEIATAPSAGDPRQAPADPKSAVDEAFLLPDPSKKEVRRLSESEALSSSANFNHDFNGQTLAIGGSSTWAFDRTGQWQPPSVAGENYQDFKTNPVKLVAEEPVSTFSIDVDTASYANVRRFLTQGVLPPVDAVRTEELINYFDYGYALPESKAEPFRADVALFDSPWDSGSQILRVGIQGYDIPAATRPPANLVFLVDTSGSMQDADKLPLVKQSLRLLVDQMGPQDSIAIVAYAGDAGVVLEPTRGSDHRKIEAAIDNFAAGGSTAGGEGIRQAYALAESVFQKEALNRVILATDGDFNVGITDPDQLEDFVARKRESGVYLSVLGFGAGNLNDLIMQKLSQAGNGNAAYIDSLMEARKVLVEEMGSTLFTIADDMKIQIEFNPDQVAEYRLIGYETRLLAREDFNNDKVDAGEVGSGSSVTAIYEITPPNSGSRLVDDLRYGDRATAPQETSNEVGFLRIRYKLPGAAESTLIEQPVMAASRTGFDAAPADARFAAAVAAFGQLLRHDPNVGAFTYADVHRIAAAARGEDESGYRSEFLRLVQLAQSVPIMESLN
ncbi:MAG: vWA domain-containing protein [Dongiaceae bacterium]